MPIRVDNDLPAREVLESENIFMMGEERADTQQIRPLEIVILNLMPLKQDYEIQLLRALSNTPLQVNVTCMNVSSHVSKHTSASHINKFYTTFEAVRNMYFDGLIITGAPVETMEFEEVSYWEELASIMEWSKTNVTSTFHICWGALFIIIMVFKRHRQERSFQVCIATAFLTAVSLLCEALMMCFTHRIRVTLA